LLAADRIDVLEHALLRRANRPLARGRDLTLRRARSLAAAWRRATHRIDRAP
jgi:hypothetical protein